MFVSSKSSPCQVVMKSDIFKARFSGNLRHTLNFRLPVRAPKVEGDLRLSSDPRCSDPKKPHPH